MAKHRGYMDRDERKGEIMVTLYAAYEPCTIGTYARIHGISVSPHLRGVFAELVAEGLIERYHAKLPTGAVGFGYLLSDTGHDGVVEALRRVGLA